MPHCLAAGAKSLDALLQNTPSGLRGCFGAEHPKEAGDGERGLCAGRASVPQAGWQQWVEAAARTQNFWTEISPEIGPHNDRTSQ